MTSKREGMEHSNLLLTAFLKKWHISVFFREKCYKASTLLQRRLADVAFLYTQTQPPTAQSLSPVPFPERQPLPDFCVNHSLASLHSFKTKWTRKHQSDYARACWRHYVWAPEREDDKAPRHGLAQLPWEFAGALSGGFRGPGHEWALGVVRVDDCGACDRTTAHRTPTRRRRRRPSCTFPPKFTTIFCQPQGVV